MSDGAPVDIWYITIPAPGAPGRKRRKGVDKIRWNCPPHVSDLIKARLERLNPAIRKGAPHIYCNDEELAIQPGQDLTPDLGFGFDSPNPSALAPVQPPPPPPPPETDEHLDSLKANLRETELQLRAVRALADAEMVRLKSLQEEIVARKAERDVEVSRHMQLMDSILATARNNTMAHVNAIHAQGLQRAQQAMDFDKAAQDRMDQTMVELANNGTRTIGLREALHGSITGNSMSEGFKTLKELAEMALGSDLMKVTTMAVTSKVASDVSRRLGREIEPDAVMQAQIVSGEHFLKRRGMLQTFCASHPGPMATAMQIAMSFEDGHLEFAALEAAFA